MTVQTLAGNPMKGVLIAANIQAVTYGRTESGDDLPIVVWLYDPTEDDVNSKYRSMLPQEYEECGGVAWTKTRSLRVCEE